MSTLPRTLLAFGLALTLAPLAAAQDPGEAPTYGDVHLDEGFEDDPHSLALVAGGTVEMAVGECAFGFVAEAPDVDLYYTTSGGSDLYIFGTSDVDTTILVNLPDGSWVCDDDSYGDGDPMVVIPNAPDGLYDIWIGTYEAEPNDATLFISEIDPR